jgi:hypothetical protein
MPALLTLVSRLERRRSEKAAWPLALGIRFAVLVQPRGAALFYLVVPEHLLILVHSIRVGDL